MRIRRPATGLSLCAFGRRPASTIRAVVEFTLDGKRVSAPEGELLVHAAARVARSSRRSATTTSSTPTGLPHVLVDLEGAPRPVPACAQRVREGMVVSTNGENGALRKTLTEMLLAEHLSPNPGGRPNELTDLAEESTRRRRSCCRTRPRAVRRTATA